MQHGNDIFSRAKLVEWGGETNLPHPIFGQKGFDLSKFKISADDALRIAEENGGAKFRSDYNNECNIQLYLLVI